MKKEAFTLLELIFVIIIIGILSAVAVSRFKPHYLSNDMNFVLIKLEEIRYKGMGYNKALPILSSDVNYSIGCIKISDLDDTNDTRSNSEAYKFHAKFDSIDPSSLSENTLLCFDTLGRVHNDDNKTALDSLLSKDINLTYSYNNHQKSIIIDHLTGEPRIK